MAIPVMLGQGPNITGEWKPFGLDVQSPASTGAFVNSTWSGNSYCGHRQKGGDVQYANFTAKNSNSKYGASNTVQPSAFYTLIIIKT